MTNKDKIVNLEVVSENQTEVVYRRALTDEEKKQGKNTSSRPTVIMPKMSQERFDHLKVIEVKIAQKIKSEKNDRAFQRLKHIVSSLMPGD